MDIQQRNYKISIRRIDLLIPQLVSTSYNVFAIDNPYRSNLSIGQKHVLSHSRKLYPEFFAFGKNIY